MVKEPTASQHPPHPMNADVACNGLQAAVKTFFRKYKKRFQGTSEELELLQKRIGHLVQHAQLVLRQLTVKRISLEHAVHALRESWKDDYQATLRDSQLQNLRAVLEHLLQQYVRIGDGMVLLESGECRHVGDYPQKNYRYKSQLTKNQVRGDGYTVLYSKDLKYSGFGWDEFFDNQYGVQARLMRALQKLAGGKSTTSIWDALLETGAQLFESSFDTHETEVQAVRKSLEAFRDTVKSDLLQLLHQFGGGGGKVHFATQDKMEFIEVKMRKQVAGVSSVKLQRRGDEFQLKNRDGVMPDGWNRITWKNHMELPSRIRIVAASSQFGTKKPEALTKGDGVKAVKKRRLVIEDSSDDEEGDAGFHVRENKIQNVETKDMTSLNAIKTDLGVNALELETAREGLEAEQEPQKQLNEKGGSIEQAVLDLAVQTRKTCVKRLRKDLQRVINKHVDINDVWDAREHLREETMELGCDLLEIQSPTSSQHLLDAKTCFKEATRLILEQEALHKLIVKDTNDNTEGAWRFQRNLLLLKGRAQTNHGIALLELSLIPKAPLATKKKYRVEATQKLSLAELVVKELQSRILRDKKRGASASETAKDSIDATQLEALALQWHGSVLWLDGKQAAATNKFHEATCTYEKTEDWVLAYVETSVDFFSDYLAILKECYTSARTLFELAAGKIKGLRVTGPDADVSKRKGSDLVIVASNALEQAKSVTVFLEKLVEKCSTSRTFEEVLADTDLLNESDLDADLADLKNLWKQRVENKLLPEKLSTNQLSGMPRNDLGAGMLLARRGNNDVPKRRFIISDYARARRPGKNKGANKESFHFEYNPFREEAETVPVPRDAVVYMKWGDELLSGVEGDPGSSLSYPACAPPRPPNFPLQ
jgi:hypothetical protein